MSLGPLIVDKIPLEWFEDRLIKGAKGIVNIFGGKAQGEKIIEVIINVLFYTASER